MLLTTVSAVLASALLVQAQSSTTYRAIPTLPSVIDADPSLTPNILDPTAPDSQLECPGYVASNVQQTNTGMTADLNLAGPACDTYGTDIDELVLLVEYQSTRRLHVQITPKYLAPENMTQFFLPQYISGYPSVVDHKDNDLAFEYQNSPDFQFQIKRVSDGDILFSTYGHRIVFQNQFIELATNMVPDYNVYGLAENIHDFRLGNNYTQTFYAVDAGNTVDGNVYGTHPLYIENRYLNSSAGSAAHGVYARNAHGQEWLLRSDNITYRTLGGSFDFYFLSGPKPMDVVSEYQAGIVGTPAMQMYWTFGFHQCRWGYTNWSNLQDVVDNYRAANIPLEVIWTDIDYMDQYRDFTNGEENFPVGLGQQFLAKLHAGNQHYVPIVDSNVYAPNPNNASDAYEPFNRGAAMNAFIRNGDIGLYYGDNWPGFSVWADWLVQQSRDFWTYELADWYTRIPYDGIWIDLSEASSFCVGSCGTGELTENPVHPPFLLPDDPGNFDYEYPEAFNITNATEYASAMSASASQASSVSATMTSNPATMTTAMGRTIPTPGVRSLNFPPYVINNVQAGHALPKGAISPNATHNDPYNSTEYDFHNVFGHMISNATYHALLQVFPNRRPFTLGRSTFAGSGNFTSHWGGDNTSKWGSMYLSISQAFTFMIAGIPMFGPDTCGFTHNSDFELCSRWMSLSAFYPFYRNHNVIQAISQEAYVWSSTAAASRNAMFIRYSLLPYLYTLFYRANQAGDMVLRPLNFEFPDDPQLASVGNQLLFGPSILVTPVLLPGMTTVQGVFPGLADGVKWYDWYTLDEVDAQPGENVTMDAPLETINVHIRGGSVLPIQEPGYTTEESRNNPYSLLIALDKDGKASGSLYLDDGESIVQNATKMVNFSFDNHVLRVDVSGDYHDTNPLANITIAGFGDNMPSAMQYKNKDCFEQHGVVAGYSGSTLKVTGLAPLFKDGAYAESFAVVFLP